MSFKNTVRLKEGSPKASRSISRVSAADLPSFTQNFDADTLLDFASHCRQNEIQSQKTMRVHSMVSHGRLMQQACREV
jgi:hypothetical protein